MIRLVAAILAAIAVAVFFAVCIFLRVAYMLLVACSEAVTEEPTEYEVETVLRGLDQEES